MDAKGIVRLSRRGALRLAGAIVAAGGAATAMGRGPQTARAEQLRPGSALYHFDQYEQIVNRPVTVRQLFEWPNISNRELWANAVNALNAWQFAYDVPADQIQIVIQAYASTTVATYDDYIWGRYRLGDALQLRDKQGNPATINPFLHSSITADAAASPPADQSDPYYFDSSIEGLQRRGVLFLACNNSLHGDAGSAFRSGRNPDNLTLDQVVAEFQTHLMPGAILVPAGVTELARLQDKGYRMVVNN